MVLPKTMVLALQTLFSKPWYSRYHGILVVL
jgi:hypothetical protein